MVSMGFREGSVLTFFVGSGRFTRYGKSSWSILKIMHIFLKIQIFANCLLYL